MRMNALLDASLGREPLAQGAHVAVPEWLAAERVEQRVLTRQPESLPTFEPAIHGVRRVGGQRGGVRLCPRLNSRPAI
jgi:hypothetical protein